VNCEASVTKKRNICQLLLYVTSNSKFEGGIVTKRVENRAIKEKY